VKLLLTNAISAREMSSLRSAIAAAEGMQPPLVTPLIGEAKEVLVRLEEENKVKSGLVTAIASRDRNALATWIAKAQAMGMDCNESRQAAALKSRLEEEDRAMDALQKAVSARDVDALNAALSKCSNMGMESAEISSGRTLLNVLVAERSAKVAITDAIRARELNALISALSHASSLGLGASAPEVAEGIQMKNVLEAEAAAIKALDTATEASNLVAIETAIANATGLGLRPDQCPSLESALAMRDTLVAENKCRSDLTAAIAGNDNSILSKVLAEASRLGLTGPLVEEARAKNKALGARSDTLDRLSSVASSDILADLADALAEAERMGLASTPEATAAAAKMERLREENALMEELDRLTRTATTANQQELSRVVAQAMRMGLNSKFPDRMGAAKARAKALGEEVQFTMKVEVSFRNNDMNALQEALNDATAARINTAFGQKKLQELVHRQTVTRNLEEALASKNQEAVKSLLQEAKECGLHNETVNQAVLFADRAGIEAKLYVTFKQAESDMDLKRLNDAIESAIELGLRTAEVENAQRVRAQLEIYDSAASDMTAATQVVVVKLESGIVDSDLTSLKQAVVKAQTVREYPPPPPYIPTLTLHSSLSFILMAVECSCGMEASC
jgi:hypothetical protein